MQKNKSKYGTKVMKAEECLLFAEAAIENGSDVQEAIQDMKMLDNMLYAEQIYRLARTHVRKTKAGHYRKGSEISDLFLQIIEGRANGIEM